MDEIENCGKIYWKNFGSPWAFIRTSTRRWDWHSFVTVIWREERTKGKKRR